MHSPVRLTLPGDEKGDARKIVDKKSEIKKRRSRAKIFVPVKAEDVGVEAVDDLHVSHLAGFSPRRFFSGLVRRTNSFRLVAAQKQIEKIRRCEVGTQTR